jgi:HPr kinase/phosphorylase
VAIPHGKLGAVGEIVACLGRAPNGVEFDSMDGQPTYLFFVLVAPESSTGAHLKALARISRVFKDPEFRRRLLAAADADTMYHVVADEREVGIRTLLASEPACIVVCRDLVPPDELRVAADERGVPLLISTLVTADFIALVTAWMADRLAPAMEMHGVLMDVLGIGVLMIGKSGIGKSETALDLVVRGHRLVADDVIVIHRHGPRLTGRGAGILGHHMEIRGLGIINVKDLFGISSVRDAKRIELVVELHEWDASVEYDRLGFDEQIERLLDVGVAKILLPVRPGRNIATLIEVAARNQLLKAQGIHSARAFRDRLHQAMGDADQVE